MRKIYLISFLAAAYCFILGAPFIFRPASVADDAQRKLIVLSPHPEEIRYEYASGFKDWMWKKFGQKVDVEWLDTGGTVSQVRYVLSQFKAHPDGIGVDVFFGGGTEPYLRFAREGFLFPYKVPQNLLEKIPSEYAGIKMYDAEKGWYGAAVSGFGIIYNILVSEKMGLPIPQTWADLGDKRLKGWVSSGDPANSGSIHVMFEIITQSRPWAEAWELVTRIGGNVRYFSEHSSNMAQEVAVGEVSSGICIDFYAGAEIAEAGKDKVGFVLPRNMTVINPDSIAILKGAPDRELAELFLQYVLSEDGQKLLLLPAGSEGGPKKYNLARIPMIPALFDEYAGRSILTFNPYKESQWFKYNFDKASVRWDVMNDLWRTMVIDNHDLLIKAWGRVIELGFPKDLSAMLFEPLVGENEVMEAAKRWHSDDLYKTNMKNKWSRALKERYEDIIAKAAER